MIRKLIWTSVLCLILLLGWSSLIKTQELQVIPEHSLNIVYRKMPFFRPVIELKREDGEILARQFIERDTAIEYIEIHYDDTGIVVLSGNTEWVWSDDLWK